MSSKLKDQKAARTFQKEFPEYTYVQILNVIRELMKIEPHWPTVLVKARKYLETEWKGKPNG